MAKTLLGLAQRLESYANQIEKSASNCAVELATNIVIQLANNTPVDTSQAISSWVVTLSKVTTLKLPPYYPGAYGSTKNSSVNRTIKEAVELLKKKKPGQIIYIQNNQPYIKRLNEGYSKQAPAMYVEASVLVAKKQGYNFKVRLKK